MDRYWWNILWLCEMRWKNLGETTTEEGHKVFFSGKEDKHEHGFGFLVHMDIVNNCHRMSPCLKLAHHHPPEGNPFQHYNTASVRHNVRLWWQRNRRILWPATECHWSDTGEGHCCCARRLECKSGQGCFSNDDTNKRGLRLLEFATFNHLVLANTFGHYRAYQKMDLA